MSSKFSPNILQILNYRNANVTRDGKEIATRSYLIRTL